MDNRPAHQKVDPYTANPEAHQAFVLRVLKCFAREQPISDDMVSDANFGLALACLGYDPEHRVDGKPIRFITFAYHCIWNELLRGRKARQKFIPVHEGQRLIEIGASESIDVADTHQDQATEIESDVIEKLRWSIEHLAERDQEIIRLRMEGLTLEEVGRHLNLTRERVRQLQDRAHRQLHSFLYGMGVKNI
jgi:RNA polymerase sigma factor (sigma-70 family)